MITVELLGLERLTSAFGLMLLPQGVATMIGAPIAGTTCNCIDIQLYMYTNGKRIKMFFFHFIHLQDGFLM